MVYIRQSMPTLIIDRKKVGERVKSLREGFGLTGKEFAQQLGITPSYLTQIEKGQRKISVEAIFSLVNAFSVSVNWLILGEGPVYMPKQRGSVAAGRPALAREPMADYGVSPHDAKITQEVMRLVARLSPEKRRALLALLK